MNRCFLTYSVVEFSQNTEKSSGDLKKLAVSPIPVKNLQLTSKIIIVLNDSVEMQEYLQAEYFLENEIHKII